MRKRAFILLMAGKGQRAIDEIHVKKQFYLLSGKEVFLYPLNAAIESGLFSEIILVIDPEDVKHVRALCDDAAVIYGGENRNSSVKNALTYLKDKGIDEVYIHDAARPMLSAELLKKIAEEKESCEALTLALPISDSILRRGERIQYVDRDELMAVHTPQVFNYSLILEAYEDGNTDRYTDDFEKILSKTKDYKILRSAKELIKITEKEDLLILEGLLSLKR